MATEQEVLRVIAFLISAYPNFDPSRETVSIYVQMLEDIPATVLFAAARQCVADCRFFPTVAEIREKAEMMMGEVPTAAEAWEEVMREVRRVGYYGEPTFENPIAAEVVGAIGWRQICTSENIVADRAHFMRMYEQMAGRVKGYMSLLPSSRVILESNCSGTRQLTRSLAQALSVTEKKGLSGESQEISVPHLP